MPRCQKKYHTGQSMTTTHTFLSAILPRTGWYFAVIRRENNTRRHYPCRSIDDLSMTVQNLSAQQTDVWYSPSSYKLPKYTGPDGKTHYREKLNVQSCRAMWLDIDCDPTRDDKYPDQKAALAGLLKFTSDLDLPSPTYIVSSGGGLHVYWVFDQDIEVKHWVRLAARFKQIVIDSGLKTDFALCANEAVLLRPAGTHNHKRDTPRPVQIWREGAVVPINAWVAKLRSVAVSAPPQSAKPDNPLGQAPDYAQGGDTEALVQGAHKPSDIKLIMTKCPTLLKAIKTNAAGGEIDQPIWYAMIGLASYTKQGRGAAHHLSSGDPRYNPDETNAKIDQWRANSDGPPTCAHIRGLPANACGGCQQTCNSPISLGYPEPKHATEVEAPPAAPGAPPKKVDIPALPANIREKFRFDLSEGGLMMLKEIKATAKKPARSFWINVSPAFLYITYAYHDENGKHHARVRAMVRNGVWEENDIEANKIGAGGAQLAGHMMEKTGVRFSDNEALKQFVGGWWDNLRANNELEERRRHMGWQKDGGFVFGEQLLGTDGSEKHCSVVSELGPVTAAHHVRGSRDKQIEALDKLYNKPEREVYQFTNAASLGSPLIWFLHEREPVGVPVSLYDPKGGKGKTSVVRTAISLWGDAEGNAQMANANQMTLLGMYIMAGQKRNLPIAIDETTSLSAKRLATMGYDFSQGLSKIQGKAEGGLRDNSNITWKNIALMTGNRSLKASIEAYLSEPGPKLARVFEVRVPNIKLDPDDRQWLGAAWANYGHIGHEFIKWVTQNQDYVSQVLEACRAWLVRTLDADSDARFWISTGAAAICANRIAHRLGLFSWGTDHLEKWIISQIRDMIANSKDVVENNKDFLGRMMADLNGGVLYTDVMGALNKKKDANGKPIGPAIIDSTLPAVRSKVMARYLTTTGDMFVPVKIVKRWCSDNGLAYADFYAEVTASGILVDGNRRVSLTTGVNMPGGQQACWHLNFSGAVVRAAPTIVEQLSDVG